MEKDFWNELQQRLDQIKQQPLTYQYQAPEEAWRKLKKLLIYRLISPIYPKQNS